MYYFKCCSKTSDMFADIKIYQKFGVLLLILIFMNVKIFAFGNSTQKNRYDSLSVKECTVLCEKLNLSSKSYLTDINNIINITKQKSKTCALLLSKSIYTNKVNITWENLDEVHNTKYLKINFINFLETNNSTKLNLQNRTTVLSSKTCRNFINSIGRTLRKFLRICVPRLRTYHMKKKGKIFEQPSTHCTEGKWPVSYTTVSWPNFIKQMTEFNQIKKFNIINEEPEHLNIHISEGLKADEIFLWYANYANTTTPRFECAKILRQNFTVHVTSDVNYLICLAIMDKNFQMNIFDCQPFKTKPLHENQPLLIKKSLPALIISLIVFFILAMAMGASILYLTIHKNPSLIRGGKRVIEVKRQDKAHVLIMPKDYESLPQADNPLALSIPNDALETEISTLSCDTNSTISYVSANQPTPVEILTYRLNRLKELFQSSSNNIPQSNSSIQTSVSLIQRLPPNVDLLLEYEWYTIAAKIITATMEDE